MGGLANQITLVPELRSLSGVEVSNGDDKRIGTEPQLGGEYSNQYVIPRSNQT